MIRGILHSVAARGVTFPLTALAVLATTYLTISYAGSGGFASISLISSLFLLVIYADLGLGAAVINVVAETQDAAHRNMQVSSVFRLLLIPAGILAVLGIAGNTLFSWATLLGVQEQSSQDVDSVTMCVFLIFAAAVPFGVGQRILTGLKLNHIGVLLSSCSSLVTLLITVLLTSMRVPFLWLSLGQSAGVLVAALICSFVAFRKIGFHIQSLWSGPSASWRPFFVTAGPMLIVMIGMPIAFQSHKLVLSHFGSVAALAEYSLALQFYNPIWSFISVAAMSLWPAFAEKRAQGEDPGKFGLLFGVLGGSALCMGTGLVLFGESVGHLLSTASISLGLGILVAFACLLLIQAIQQVPGMYFTNSSGLRFQAVCVVVMCIVSVSGSVIITPIAGAVGPVASTAFGVAVCQVLPGLLRLLRARRKRHGPGARREQQVALGRHFSQG